MERQPEESSQSDLSAYLFLLIHMLMFGGTGFFLAYFTNEVPLAALFVQGGFAIALYSVIYIRAFGLDEVKWMIINAGLGLYGIYAEVDLLLSILGKSLSSYPIYLHVVPFLYYVLYTFLLRQGVLDIFKARTDSVKKKWVDRGYIFISFIFYSYIFAL